MKIEKTDLEKERDYISILLSQDLFDFKCYGHMISKEREDNFKEKLKIWSELNKKITHEWQNASRKNTKAV